MAAEDLTGTVVANARGIEHVLYLAVRSDPTSQLLTQAGGEAVTAKLGVKLRISAHSQEANFFGIVPAAVSEFDLGKGSPDQEVWRDGKCHHERGFPKISVTAVDGSIKNGRRQIPVDARWRQLGLFVPQDEVQHQREWTMAPTMSVTILQLALRPNRVGFLSTSNCIFYLAT